MQTSISPAARAVDAPRRAIATMQREVAQKENEIMAPQVIVYSCVTAGYDDVTGTLLRGEPVREDNVKFVLFTSKVALSKTSLDVMLTIKLILVLAELFSGFIIVILGLKASKDLIASKIFILEK